MHRLSALLILGVGLLTACKGNMEYDISEGYNKDITLFQEEIAVPIGSIGPLTIKETLGGLDKLKDFAGGLLANYLYEGEDGTILLRSSGDIFKINVYELRDQLGESNANDYSWNAGDQRCQLFGLGSILTMLGLNSVEQQLIISGTNPLDTRLPMHCQVQIVCKNKDFEETYSQLLEDLSNYNFKYNYSGELVSVMLPSDVSDRISSIELKQLTYDFPANLLSRLYSTTGELFLDVSYEYINGIAVGENFKQSIPVNAIHGLNVPLSQFNLHKCELSVEVENTLPMAVTISDLSVLKPKTSEDEKDEVDENIKITSGITIPGGSLEKPSTVTLHLALEALSGCIPDIEGIGMKVSLAGEQGLGFVPLSVHQGLYVKSSSAKVSGGITIPRN